MVSTIIQPTESTNMKAFLIVETHDPETAEWFYAHASWQALDAAKAAGFDESKGFAVVLTLPIDAVSISA